MWKAIIGAVAMLFAVNSNVSEAAVYNVDRNIGFGSVVGTVETNGSLGVLTSADITGFDLTISAPNLFGGNPSETISLSNGGSVFLDGNALEATATQLIFDFSVANASLTLRESIFQYVLQTELVLATDDIPGEAIGLDPTATQAAQSVGLSGRVAFATVSQVPVPAALPLLITALAGFGLIGWRRRRVS